VPDGAAASQMTTRELVEKAIELRPLLIERQAETEELTYPARDIHEKFVAAGFYGMYVPRRYGGLEVDMETYMRVVLELARGCVSSAWCMCLAANHALQIGSWF
jgi:3-hydroxy-9,10-secoandrosta-1,3,5(10)-triene-9,17-dione monooxygenase